MLLELQTDSRIFDLLIGRLAVILTTPMLRQADFADDGQITHLFAFYPQNSEASSAR